jgi:serine/threonine protein kinase
MDFPVYVPGYAVDGQLDAGGDGLVWVAREEATGRHVALKLIDIADPGAREQARREASLLTTIEHPHVLPMLGIADTPGALVLVLALAGGGSLAELLAVRGTLPPGEIVTVCAPIGQALADLHARGLVHGNLTPGNVVFTADGRPMIADLGMSRLGGEFRTEVGMIDGYAAPEVQAGYPPQPGSDVYGLAVIAMRSLTGYVPAHPIVLPGIPPATQGALAQALHPDPMRRPDAMALSNALFALADPEPIMLVSDTGTIRPVQPLPNSDDRPRHRSTRPLLDEGDDIDDALGAAAATPPTGRRASRAGSAGPQPGSPGRRTSGAASSATTADDDVQAPTRRRRAPAPADVPTRGRRRDIVARIALVIAVPVILAGAVFAALQWWNGDDPSTLPSADRLTAPADADVPVDLCGGPQPAPTEQPPAVTDWTQVVESLYSLRTQAFAELDATLLCDVYTPTSPVLSRDANLLQAYADAGGRVDGLAFEVVTAELVSQEGGRVVLAITDRLPPYELVDDDGEVVAEWEGLPEETWQAELVPAPDASGWRFS